MPGKLLALGLHFDGPGLASNHHHVALRLGWGYLQHTGFIPMQPKKMSSTRCPAARSRWASTMRHTEPTQGRASDESAAGIQVLNDTD